MLFKFPPGFLWGSSISSYQVEGGNIYSDWSSWEKENKLTPANEACRHYSLYPADFSLASDLGHNSLRLSLEWARICPEEGAFSQKEIRHYSDVIKELRSRGLAPILTLHHFTNPIWFSKKGGWLTSKSIDYFLAYVRKAGELFKSQVNYWIVFNEPVVYIYNGFIKGLWPPGYKSFKKAETALKNITKSYILAYKELKRICGRDDCKISIAKHIRIFSPCPHYNLGQNSPPCYLRNKIFNYSLIEMLLKAGTLDFLSLNYYCKEYDKFNFSLFGKECKENHHRERKNTLGWYIYPQGLYEILMRLKSYQLPIMITENGTSESEDKLYEDFLFKHLKAVALALKQGVKVIGYMWWSLLDNFEWDKGFSPRFGLLKVNYNDFKREIKPFSLFYKRICQNNGIDI